MEFKIETKGFEDLFKRMDAVTQVDVIKRSLSMASIELAQWSADKRIAKLNKNRKQVLPDKLTARSDFGYKDKIFGQPPESVEKRGNSYFIQFGTNANNNGFSYPRLHEFGGQFVHARPVLTPAIQDEGNQKMVLDIFINNINEALSK